MGTIHDFIKRIGNTYDTNEVTLLQEIDNCYVECGLKERGDLLRFVPAEIDISKGEKPIRITHIHLEHKNWKNKIGPSPIWQKIQELYTTICKFQTYRYRTLGQKLNRMVWYDTLNDPISVALEELKYWMSMELSTKDFSNAKTCIEVKKEIHERIKYIAKLDNLKNIINSESAYFKVISTPEMNISQVFIQITCTLEEFIIPVIDFQMSRQTSRDYFNSLKIANEMMISNCVRFLFFIYRDTPDLGSQLTIKDIRHPRTAADRAAVATKSGTMLQNILNTRFLKAVVPDIYPVPQSREARTEQLIDAFNKKTGLDALRALSKENENLLPVWWREGSSGIYEELRLPENIKIFERIHLLLILLTSYHQFFEDAHKLAGEGGDIMVYGYAQKSIYNKIMSYKNILDDLYSNIETLYAAARTLHRKKAFDGESLKNVWHNINDWRNNYGEGNLARLDVISNIDDAYIALAAINTGLHTKTLNERLNDAAKNLEGFISLCDSMSQLENTIFTIGPASTASANTNTREGVFYTSNNNNSNSKINNLEKEIYRKIANIN